MQTLFSTPDPRPASRWVSPAEEPPRLAVSWARGEDEVRQAQRLRYRVFADEMGAQLGTHDDTSPDTGHPLDVDSFDAFCDHLLVKVIDPQRDDDGLLVGTYRVLPPDAARRAGGLYIDTEFDLAPLLPLRAGAVELGRSCVHPDWRHGSVILALWAALCQYMATRRLQTMIGCASVALHDEGESAARLWQRLSSTYLVAPQWQVRPLCALPLTAGESDGGMPAKNARHAAPPLIKGYLRCGARLLGPPALDTAFNTADLPMMLRFQDLAPRYRRHFLGH